MSASKYSIQKFINDAKVILEKPDPLEKKKASIAERMIELSKRDDLIRVGRMTGYNDATPQNWMLWQEPGASLHVAGMHPGHSSPVHEHGNYWAIACGYRGHDRWDMYERVDDGARPGYAEVKLVDQYDVVPGKAAWMPAPPRAIHSHNNASSAEYSQELIFFSTNDPPPPSERLIYDVEEKRCWPSTYDFRPAFAGEYYPPRVTQSSALSFSGLKRFLSNTATASTSGAKRLQHMFCPVCNCAV